MPSLKDIRKRISTVRNTQKITRAMKMVAASKLRRAEMRVKAARPYALKMRQVIEGLADRVEEEAHPLLEQREQRDHVIILTVASNRGLCGGFNSNLFRELERYIRQHRSGLESLRLATISRKASQYFKSRDVEILRDYPDVIGDVTYKKAKAIAQDAMQWYLEGEADAVYIAYNEFASAIRYEQRIVQLLPLDAQALEASQAEQQVSAEGEAGAGGLRAEYEYEPDAQSLLDRLLPNSVEIRILQALLESEAAEHAARMTAMDSASKNAGELIDSLTLQYNRARQAYITKELVEIVSGAESLKG